MEDTHHSVLVTESIEYLDVKPGKWYIDATFGRGGHSKEILIRGGNVIAIDCDDQAIGYGFRMFVKETETGKVKLVHENFDRIGEVVQRLEPEVAGNIYGVLADFGVSSPQLDLAERGFSFEKEATLDMRMDKRLGVLAKDLVNALGKKELEHIIKEIGGDHHARIIAEAILQARAKQPIETTTQLASIVEKVVHREGRLHPATKLFMALRIVVNDELGSIERFLPDAFNALASDGMLVTISFHEGEDRLVKQFMKEKEAAGLGTLKTKKPVEPSTEELGRNPRSRSAKLRAVQKHNHATT